ncbi:MAG: hypothetical protein H5U36_04665 [Candidatus Caldatribacterium sp.]|nr:hypothetical protein [Candidatus Caldatribacterium sp.]
MKRKGVLLVFGRGRRLFRFALSLGWAFGARPVFSEVLPDESFFAGKRAAATLLPRISVCPFLCVAESHAFTGGMVAGLVENLSFPPYLFVLDAHLDLFSSPQVSFPIHRGNFLAYLLKRKGFPEDHLFVCSDIEALKELEEKLRVLPPRPFYLSWDVDFGFPEVAYFPGRVPSACLEDFFLRLALCCRRRGFHFLGGDLVELNPWKIQSPSSFALRVARYLLPFFREEERR